jgi:hypothetical protein
MRRLHSVVICFALAAMGCDSTFIPPTAPTPNPPAAPTPTPVPQPRFEQRLEIGEVIKTRVTREDPLCSEGWPYRCRYYGLTPATNGLLNITMTWQNGGVYPLDFGVYDAQGRSWDAVADAGLRRSVTLPVTAGATYVIEIWSFLEPGEEFELGSSIGAK